MPYKEKEITKIYYSIGEVADRYSVNTSLIRFWEKEFDIIKPKKNKKGNRLFTVKDLDHFDVIYQLVKKEGYTLDGAKKALRNSKKELELKSDLRKSLELIKKNLLSMREGL